MSRLPSSVFITGGAGTLGKAIISRAKKEGWDTKFTVYSRDAHKQDALVRIFPDVRCVIGDIRDTERLTDLMVGHDLVIHAAAIKHIPQAEQNVLETIGINVNGSLSVGMAAKYAGIEKVVGISTDKACHAVNTYGASKYLMEKAFQEMGYNLVRYGNVIGSVGSVVQVWKDMAEKHGKITATSPDPTRFWITADEAVSLILFSLDAPPSTISIPRLPATTIGQLKDYLFPDVEVEYTGMRPGEKMHEEMLTREEANYAVESVGCSYVVLYPTTSPKIAYPPEPLTSDNPLYWLSREQVLEMIA